MSLLVTFLVQENFLDAQPHLLSSTLNLTNCNGHWPRWIRPSCTPGKGRIQRRERFHAGVCGVRRWTEQWLRLRFSAPRRCNPVAHPQLGGSSSRWGRWAFTFSDSTKAGHTKSRNFAWKGEGKNPTVNDRALLSTIDMKTVFSLVAAWQFPTPILFLAVKHGKRSP